MPILWPEASVGTQAWPPGLGGPLPFVALHHGHVGRSRLVSALRLGACCIYPQKKEGRSAHPEVRKESPALSNTSYCIYNRKGFPWRERSVVYSLPQ